MQVARAFVGTFALGLIVASASAQVDFRRPIEAVEAPPPAVERRADDLTVEQPHEAQLVDENPRCQQYANRAADQYRLAKRRAECDVALNELWHDDVARHYNWCLHVTDAKLDAAQNERDTHLSACGGQRRG